MLLNMATPVSVMWIPSLIPHPKTLRSLLATSGREVYLSQTEQDVRCRLQLWTMFISCKTVYAEKTLVEVLPEGTDPGSGCWTPSGWFVFCGPSADVYRVQPCVFEPELCVKHDGSARHRTGSLIRPTRQGFVLYAAGELTVIRAQEALGSTGW